MAAVQVCWPGKKIRGEIPASINIYSNQWRARGRAFITVKRNWYSHQRRCCGDIAIDI